MKFVMKSTNRLGLYKAAVPLAVITEVILSPLWLRRGNLRAQILDSLSLILIIAYVYVLNLLFI